MALTTESIRAFRVAATLADVIPSVRIRVRDGQRPVLHVAPPMAGDDEGGSRRPDVPWVPPCAFRAAVGRAWRLHREGTLLRFLDVDADREPAVDIGLRPGDAVLPGDLYRFRAADERQLVVFLTGLGPEACEEAVAGALATAKRCDRMPVDGGTPSLPRRVGFHADGVTEVTVVHTMAGADDLDRAVRLMGRLLEVCVAQEAITELAAVPTTPSPSEPDRPPSR